MDEKSYVHMETGDPDPLAAYAAALLERANAQNIPSGILHWSFVMPYRIAEFDGEEWRGACDQNTWRQLYLELHGGQKRDVGIVPIDALEESLARWHEREEVPIAIACYRYDTPKRTFVAKVMATARNNEVRPEPEPAEGILQQHTAFFASALLPSRSRDFELLPYEHFGSEVSFVVPRSLFLTNLEGEPRDLAIDFDDGEGFRPVAFDETVRIAYADDLPKQIRLRVAFDGKARGASFGFRIHQDPTLCTPDDRWNLVAVDRNRGIDTVGWAWVYYGPGRKESKEITDPMIFADGFGSGNSTWQDIWKNLDQGGLATDLIASGKDLILLGYARKSNSIEANGMLAVHCIEETIKKRRGTKQLIVAGGSMGGLVTRYALLWMEHMEGRPGGRGNHETATYLSYDTPHDGAWVPLIVQKLAHLLRDEDAEARRSSDLMLSPAAQQMLWGWSPTWDYHGVFNENRLRRDLFTEIMAMNYMPRQPRKYAVANGRGDGVGNGNPEGAEAMWWHGGGFVGARLMVQTAAARQFLGGFWLKEKVHGCTVENVPLFDTCPGGLGDFFGQAGDGARRSGYGTVDNKIRTSAFIPTVSALSAGRMREPFTSITSIPRERIPFDDFRTSTTNTAHVAVTEELKKFVLEVCAAKDETAKSTPVNRDRPRDSTASP